MHTSSTPVLLRLLPLVLISSTTIGACGSEPEALGEPLGLRAATVDAAGLALADVSLGESTTCVTVLEGVAGSDGVGRQTKCWGRLSDTTSEPDPLAGSGLDLGVDPQHVVTDGSQSLALLDDGTVRSLDLDVSTVDAVVPLSGPALQLVMGEAFACARLPEGRVQCWGRGDEGQLGRGVESGSYPPRDVQLGAAAVEITAGAAHACARLGDGAVRCWGLDDVGQLGYGEALGDQAVPATAGDVPLGGVAIAVVAGGAHTCARLEGGTLRCWGDDSEGQLGYGALQAIGDDETPAEAGDVPLGGAVLGVAAGLRHTCAVLEGGTLRCWGEGTGAQRGLDPAALVDTGLAPGEAGGESGVGAVFAGALAEHTCAVRGDGSLRCWGRNEHGQLGLGFVSPPDVVEGPPGDLPDVIIVEDPDV